MMLDELLQIVVHNGPGGRGEISRLIPSLIGHPKQKDDTIRKLRPVHFASCIAIV